MIHRPILLLAALLLSLAACGKPVGSFRIEARDYAFKPAAVSVKPGQKVTLVIRNVGKERHNFTYPAIGADKDLDPGESLTVRFTSSSTATHQGFFCKYHREQQDMVGNVNVPSIDRPGPGRPGG